MTHWKKQIEELRQVRGAATQGEWKAMFVFGSKDLPASVDCGDVSIVHVQEDCSKQPTHDVRFIAESANRWNDLLRVIEVMGEALEKYHEADVYEHHGEEYGTLANKALTTASRILSGEGEEK
jgi:hypothetical protein